MPGFNGSTSPGLKIENIANNLTTTVQNKVLDARQGKALKDLIDAIPLYDEATTSLAGLLSASDKTKLDGIATGAQVNSITGIKGDAENAYRTGNINLTAANIGAVSKSGDTMTGNLQITKSSHPSIYFLDSANNNYESVRIYAELADNRLIIRQKHKSEEFHDAYYMPAASSDGKDHVYNILTTKDVVGVQNGGTGATTAAGALTALGAASATDVNNKINNCIKATRIEITTGSIPAGQDGSVFLSNVESVITVPTGYNSQYIAIIPEGARPSTTWGAIPILFWLNGNWVLHNGGSVADTFVVTFIVFFTKMA